MSEFLDRMFRSRGRILHYLSTREEAYGLSMIRDNVASGLTLYVTLAQMEEHGLIVSHETNDLETGLRRRSYKITEKGSATLLPTAKVIDRG